MKKIIIIIIILLEALSLFSQAPTNDNCNSPSLINISDGGFGLGDFNSDEIDLTNATIQIGEYFHSSQVSAGIDKKTIWYSFYLPTSRAIKIELLQSVENIPQNGAGFTVYKANTCFPGLDEITAAKLTPINKFGNTYNPCLSPGHYLIQVSAKQNSNGAVYLKLTSLIPGVLNNYDTENGAYYFGTISSSWTTLNFDVGCQTIKNASETCTNLGTNYEDYTQSAWFVFETPANLNLLTIRIGEQTGFFSGNLKFGFNIYQGDVRNTNYESLTLVDGCNVYQQNYPTQSPYLDSVPIKNYLCNSVINPNTTYSLQIFFHKDYINSVFVQLFARSSISTLSPNPTSINPSSNFGVLTGSTIGTYYYGYDNFACNAFISDNSCGTVNPSSGDVIVNGTAYNMSTWYKFQITDFVNVRFITHYAFAKRLFYGDVSSDCNLAPIEVFTSGDYTVNCLQPGTYSLQILGKTYDAYSYLNTGYNSIGLDANIALQVFNNNINSSYLLDAANRVDFVNTISGIWTALPEDITITSSTGRFNCQKTVLPLGSNCSSQTNRAMYREIIVGDADGDGINDDGIITMTGGNYFLNYLFYKGDANSLAIAQNAFNYGQNINGLQQLTECSNLYYASSAQKVCVKPGIYTLVTYGKDNDVGRTDNPRFRFNKVTSLYTNPSNPENLGNITSILNTSGSISSSNDIFSCIDNPLTIAGQNSCNSANKQIYREFYISEDMILNISVTRGVFRLFYGRISVNGVNGVTPNIPGIGNIGCVASYYTDVCERMPAGWYSIVTYGNGGSYDGPIYFGGVTGQTTRVNISKVSPLSSPNYNIPANAYYAGITDWGPNSGNAAFPQNGRTYTFGTEIFNCSNDLPLLVSNCTGYNRQAFYVFEITKESYLSIRNIPTSMKVQLYSGDVRTQYENFPSQSPIQGCSNITSIGSYDRFLWMWTGQIELCRMQPGVYTLIIYANDSHIGSSVTPQIYVDNIEESRFDFAANAYDFGVIPSDNSYYWGKPGDIPLVPGRSASNDFFSCKTGAFPQDPEQGTCWAGDYPISNSSSVIYPMNINTPHYTSGSTNVPIRRNLWYTFVIDGPGIVTVKVQNKTTGKTLQNYFSIYESDVDGDLDFYTQVVPDVDSTITQGLTLKKTNSTYDSWGCAGNLETVTFSIDPCQVSRKRRFFIVVDQHVGLIPNSQIEVGIKHDAFSSLQSKYDHFAQANLIGAPESDPPYTNTVLSEGYYYGKPSSFACATKSTTDQNSCGERTLWYKFNSSINGKVRIAFEINGSTHVYNNQDILIYRQIVPNDSTLTGLSLQNTTSVIDSSKVWGETCLKIGTYYIMLTGCSYSLENVRPKIKLIEENGDNCYQAVPIVLNSLGSNSATVSVNCHDIGSSFGENGTNMGCLYGPQGYKSTWFRVDLNFTEKADISFSLSENTNALPNQIRYRVLYGTCYSMSAGPCNTDALTTFTLNCMLAENSSYYVQVVTPENTLGEITLTVTAQEAPNQYCTPFNPLLPFVNFVYQNTCFGVQTCFTNLSSQGDSVSYSWDFDISDGILENSTAFAPCYTYPAPGTYYARLRVYSIIMDPDNNPITVSDSITIPVIIYPKPDPSISRDPSGYEIISGIEVDFFSNVSVQNIISDPPTSYLWNFDNGQASSLANPEDIVYGASQLGARIVSLTVVNGTCSVTVFDNFIVGYEPIFAGGNFDGFSMSAIQGNCPIENIFAGGNFDGFAMSTIEGNCPIENIFAGGIFDGSDVTQVVTNVNFDWSNQVVCSGDTFTISVADGNDSNNYIDSISWYNGTNFIQKTYQNNLNLTYSYSSTEITSITINAHIYSPRYCDSAVVSYSYVILPGPIADAGDDKEICIGENVQIGTISTNPLWNYQWSPSSGLSDPNIPQPYASPLVTTEYVLTVTDFASACPHATDTVIVNVSTNKPLIDVSNNIICNESAAILNVSGTETGDIINWYGVGGSSNFVAIMPSLPNSSITASSEYDSNHAAYKARLNATYDPNWSAATNNTNQWIKVDCGEIIPIKAVSTQGRYGYDQWVTSYKISYSIDNTNCNFIGGLDLSTATVFTGNSDRNTVVTNELNSPINARYIRIHPVTWYSHISMRIEIYKLNSLSSTTSLSVNNAGQYYVEVSRGICLSRDTAQVISINYPAGEDASVCTPGGSTILGITPLTSASYSWSPATYLNATNIAQPIVTPSQNMNYSVTVTHPYGNCVDSVKVFAPVTVDAGPDIYICPPNGVEITPSYTGSVSSWEWATTGSLYKLPITLSNAGSALSDYQVLFTINSASLISNGKMRTDCGDLRVFDSDDSTPLDYWIVDGTCNSVNTQVWVKVPSIPVGDKTIYAHYGNLSLTSISNGNNVFLFFDDFNSSTYDNTKWTSPQGNISQNNGILTLSSNGGLIASSYVIPHSTIWESYAMTPSSTYGSALRASTNITYGYVNDGGANILNILWYGSSLYWETNTGETYAGGGWTFNSYKKYKITYRPNNNDIAYFDYDNGTRTGSRSGTNAAGTLKPVLYSSSTANWDWFLIRKYADNEPIVTLGNEINDLIIANTQSYTINAIGTYYVTTINGLCFDTDTIEAFDASVNTNKLAWRTKASGNWNNTAIWEVKNNGGSWVDAISFTDVCNNPVTYPTYKDSTITIRNNHIVEFNISEAIDELTIENGARLNINNSFILQMVDSSSSSVIADITNYGIIDILNGGTFTGIGDAKIFNYGRLNIAGTFNVAGGTNLTAKLVNDNNSVVNYYLNANQNMWDGAYGILETSGTGIKFVSGINTRVNTRVDFLGSKIQLDNKNLRLSANATVTGYSYTNGYFITNLSGTVIKESFGRSTGLFVIPIGHSETSYNRLDITNTGESDDLRFRVSGQIELTGSQLDELYPISAVDRTWYITNDYGNNINLNVTLYWITAHENPNFISDQCFIAKYDMISWKRHGAFGGAQNSGTDYNNMHYFSASGITSALPLGVGSCSFVQLAYRSVSDGNWSDLYNWEVFDEATSSWISPYFYNSSCGNITYPSSLSKSILIRHNIVVDVNIAEGINSTTIDPSGIVNIPQNIQLLVIEPKMGEIASLVNNGVVNVYGNIIGNYGTVIQNNYNSNSLFEYFSNNQNVYSCRYANLKLNNGNKFNTGNNTSVYENLTFNGSKFYLNNYNLILESNSNVIGASQNNGYIVANDDAYLVMNFNQGSNVMRHIPIGGNLFSPATLNFENVTAQGSMFCRVRETTHPFDPNSIKRYWTINKGSLEFSQNYRLTLNYRDEDLQYIPVNPDDEMQLIINAGIFSLDLAPNYWIYYTTPNSNNYVPDVVNNQALILHNHFSDFTLSKQNNPLPVKWLFVDAQWKNNDGIITWVTATESNNRGFYVERFSEECNDFETIAYLEGNGNSEFSNFYEYIDENLKYRKPDIFYFRIKQIDFDNSFSYSPIVYLTKQKENNNNNNNNNDLCVEYYIYPNPSRKNEDLSILIKTLERHELFEIKLYDALGKEIFYDRIIAKRGMNLYNLNLDWFNTGVYVISIQRNNCTTNQRFVVID